MRLRTLRAAIAATALVFASTAPALAQYGGSDSRQTVTFDANAKQKIQSGTITIILWSGRFAARTTITFSIFSDPVVLGTFETDADGAVNAEVVIPDTLEAGDHTLEAAGTDPAGNPLVLRQAVVLAETVSGPSSLSLTGSDARGIAAVGGVLLVMGAAATIATRRRLSGQD